MRPPICTICKKRFAPREGGKIFFKESEEDKKYNERFKKPGFVGHKRGLEWFCPKHIDTAKKYKHLTAAEAIPKIKEDH